VLAARRRPTPREAPALVDAVIDDLLRCLDGRRPLAVGITGVAKGGVALDADLRPAGPLFWWYDDRPAVAAHRLVSRCGRTELFRRTGVDVAAKTPLALWHGTRT
jgi:xylulokinase